MKVPFNYLPLQFSDPKPYFKRWKQLIKSTEFTLGPYVRKFENDIEKFVGVKYCISTNNGTDALILALKSLGVKKGDEVITVCNTFYATVGAIVACGAKPVFVDADKRYQIDVNKIEKAITKKTKIILPVHWGGASPNMRKILKIAKKYKLEVLEDACMGIGGKIFNKSPGTFGKISAMSMHPLKSLNVMGDGGMVVTNNKKLSDWIKKFRNHGMKNRDEIDFWGVNARIQPLQAIVASIELRKIKKILKIRNLNSEFLDKELSKIQEVEIPKRSKYNYETHALYMGLFKNRDKLKNFLIKKGIEVKIHYPIPLHLQKAAKNLNYRKGKFPEAEKQAKKLLTLPVHQYLSKRQLTSIVQNIKLFYKKNEK
jgi:dTDP-4-amino-4,6-dideoxygalactose transaminase